MTAPVNKPSTCVPKVSCANGPYKGIPYDPNDPCNGSGATFSCEKGCIGGDKGLTNSGCVRIESVVDSSDNSPNSGGLSGRYYNIPSEGDYFGQNTVAGDYGLGVKPTAPVSGTEGSPTQLEQEPSFVQNCSQVDTAAGFWDFNNEFGIYDASNGNLAQSISSQLGVERTGGGHCNTESYTYHNDVEFPSWGTCTDPYRLKTEVTIVTKEGCSTPCAFVGTRTSYSVPFITYEFTDIVLRASTTCGVFSNGAAEFCYKVTSYWDSSGSSTDPFRSGLVKTDNNFRRCVGDSDADNCEYTRLRVSLVKAVTNEEVEFIGEWDL